VHTVHAQPWRLILLLAASTLLAAAAVLFATRFYNHHLLLLRNEQQLRRVGLELIQCLTNECHAEIRDRVVVNLDQQQPDFHAVASFSQLLGLGAKFEDNHAVWCLLERNLRSGVCRWLVIVTIVTIWLWRLPLVPVQNFIGNEYFGGLLLLLSASASLAAAASLFNISPRKGPTRTGGSSPFVIANMKPSRPDQSYTTLLVSDSGSGCAEPPGEAPGLGVTIPFFLSLAICAWEMRRVLFGVSLAAELPRTKETSAFA
jgi:hypothetical protein